MVDYQNGKIPPSLLRRVSNFVPLVSGVTSNAGSDLLREDAWRALVMLQLAFLDALGRNLNVSEAYRGLTRQTAAWQTYKGGGPLAAPVGTSPHGWALAVDFGSGVATYGTVAKVWMDANAPAYGWHPVGNTFGKREAWHFEFRPGTATAIIPASGGATPFPEQDGTELSLTASQQIQFLYDAFLHGGSATGQVSLINQTGGAFRDSADARTLAARAVEESTKTNVPLVYEAPNGQCFMAQPVVLDLSAGEGNGTGMTAAAQVARARRQGAIFVRFDEQADYDQWRIMLLMGR
jgi:hypothetical protein